MATSPPHILLTVHATSLSLAQECKRRAQGQLAGAQSGAQRHHTERSLIGCRRQSKDKFRRDLEEEENVKKKRGGTGEEKKEKLKEKKEINRKGEVEELEEKGKHEKMKEEEKRRGGRRERGKN